MALKAGLSKAAATLNGIMDALVAQRFRLTLWTILIGFAMILIAMMLKVSQVTFDGKLVNGFDVFAHTPTAPGAHRVATKEVGFLFAFNWSLFSIVIAPAMVWFGLGLHRSVAITLENLAERGMLRDGDFGRLDAATVASLWRQHLTGNRLLFLFAFALVIGFNLYDWWSVVGDPILHPQAVHAALNDPEMEYDWTVACLFADGHVPAMPLFAFGLAAYVFLSGMATAFALAVAISALHFIAFLTAGKVSGVRIELAAMPRLDKNDVHFGFGLFSDFFNNLLLTAIFILFALWLMMTQNIYLRDMGHADFGSFLLDDVAYAGQIVTLKTTPEAALRWLSRPSLSLIANPQTTLALLLFPFVCIIAIGSSWFLLRNAAFAARELSLRNAARLASELGARKAGIVEALQGAMVVWPVGWIRANELIVIMVTLFCSPVSYRLIVIPLAWMLLKGGKGAMKVFLKK